MSILRRERLHTVLAKRMHRIPWRPLARTMFALVTGLLRNQHLIKECTWKQ